MVITQIGAHQGIAGDKFRAGGFPAEVIHRNRSIMATQAQFCGCIGLTDSGIHTPAAIDRKGGVGGFVVPKRCVQNSHVSVVRGMANDADLGAGIPILPGKIVCRAHDGLVKCRATGQTENDHSGKNGSNKPHD